MQIVTEKEGLIKRFFRYVIFFVLLSLVITNYTFTFAAAKNSSPKLYFLSIGISSFADESYGKKGFKAPVISARLVANQLIRSGAEFGYLLIDGNNPSEPNTPVPKISRDDVFNAIDALRVKIISDGTSASARIVVYIITHGISDRSSNYRFLVPGNLVLPRDIDSTYPVSKLVNYAISDVDIITSMLKFKTVPIELEQSGTEKNDNNLIDRKQNIPFMLLLDNCADFFQEDQLYTEEFTGSIDSIYAAAYEVGRIYYAAAPGSPARTWMLVPRQEDKALNNAPVLNIEYAPWVGPLALHFSWVLNEKPSSEVMSLDAFEEKLIRNSTSGDHIPPQPFSLFNRVIPKRLSKVVPEFAEDMQSRSFFPRLQTPKQQPVLIPPTGLELVYCCD